MERYENIIKIEEIRRLTDDNQYVKALNVLKTLDTNKIKSLTDLSIIADVYTQNEEYDDAMKILTRIYAKNKTRRIVYQLVDLSIKRGDIYEAEYYLDKYKKHAERDSYQYIFRYCIDKLKQEPYDVLIESLEKLKEYDYFEVWAYELAKLYHKAGMKDRCVRECSDIILWFGNGIYVEKARLLKAYYVGEVDPIQMLKAKEKKETQMRLGLDKTKDYSSIRSEIDKFLAENDKESSELETRNKNAVINFVSNDEYGVGDTPEEILSSNHIDVSKEESSIRNSAYEDLFSAGIFTDSSYEEEVEEDSNIGESERIMEDENPIGEESIIGEDSMYQDSDANQEESYEEESYQEEIASTTMLSIEEDYTEVEDTDYAEVEDTENEEVEDAENAEVEEIENAEHEVEIEKQEYNSEDEIEHMLHLLHLKENVYLKKIFGYFMCNQECSNQIERVLNRVLLKKGIGQNFIIIGQRKSGKTTLGKCYAKALYEQNHIKSPKVAKITATKLNKINLLERIEGIIDGMLIVEEAGNLAHNTVEQIIQVSKTYEGRLLVSLEDEENNIEELLNREEKISKFFEHVIRIPKFSRNDKLGFVLCFLDDHDYKLSTEGKEILMNLLEEIEKNVVETDQLEVLFNFVKKAKLSADKRNKSLLFDIMKSRNLEINDLLYINEEDFCDIRL